MIVTLACIAAPVFLISSLVFAWLWLTAKWEVEESQDRIIDGINMLSEVNGRFCDKCNELREANKAHDAECHKYQRAVAGVEHQLEETKIALELANERIDLQDEAHRELQLKYADSRHAERSLAEYKSKLETLQGAHATLQTKCDTYEEANRQQCNLAASANQFAVKIQDHNDHLAAHGNDFEIVDYCCPNSWMNVELLGELEEFEEFVKHCQAGSFDVLGKDGMLIVGFGCGREVDDAGTPAPFYSLIRGEKAADLSKIAAFRVG